jgi:DNA-binding GntR family transcriptional regulator
MFSELVRTILRRLAVVRDMTPRRPGDREREISIHERTLAAIRSRDLARVDAAMDEHMSYLERLWEDETGRTLRHLV